jgi:hypothetical protein
MSGFQSSVTTPVHQPRGQWSPLATGTRKRDECSAYQIRHTQNAGAVGPAPISAKRHRARPPRLRTARADGRAAQARPARLSRPVSSLGENVQRIAIAADDVIGLRHLFREARIVRGVTPPLVKNCTLRSDARFADSEGAQSAVLKLGVLSPVVIAGQVDVLPLER